MTTVVWTRDGRRLVKHEDFAGRWICIPRMTADGFARDYYERIDTRQEGQEIVATYRYCEAPRWSSVQELADLPPMPAWWERISAWFRRPA